MFGDWIWRSHTFNDGSQPYLACLTHGDNWRDWLFQQDVFRYRRDSWEEPVSSACYIGNSAHLHCLDLEFLFGFPRCFFINPQLLMSCCSHKFHKKEINCLSYIPAGGKFNNWIWKKPKISKARRQKTWPYIYIYWIKPHYFQARLLIWRVNGMC